MVTRLRRAPELGEIASERLAAHVEALWRIGLLRRRLRALGSVGGLFAAGAELVRRELGYERAVVLSVEAGVLRADTTDSLPDPDSDRLRRAVLADPVALEANSREAELIRLMRVWRPARADTPSVLAEALGLREFALAPIVVESRTLAVLLADRHHPPVDALDTAALSAFAEVVAGALEHVVLRARQRELADEVRNLTASTQALMREMLEAPVTLPAARGQRESFPLVSPVSPDSARLRRRLTEGEARIAALLVQGRSNREIAEELILSTETVKAAVARILRKLGVSNRVAAAALILRLSS